MYTFAHSCNYKRSVWTPGSQLPDGQLSDLISHARGLDALGSLDLFDLLDDRLEMSIALFLIDGHEVLLKLPPGIL